MSDDIIGIGLESSCDETSASVVKNGNTILSNYVSSQIDLHKEYYGVVPEIASRAHLERINELIELSLKDAGIRFADLSYVAATIRPGLVGSLLIALQSAKAISYTCSIPLIGVNHLEAHLYAPHLENNTLYFPYIGLLVSGGNTALFNVEGIGHYTILGRTVDDAAGEAYDKVSKYLDLGYPGGPIIEKLANKSLSKPKLFSKLMTDKDDLRFSYSGLKTAVIHYMQKNPISVKEDVAYSFQETALELLVRRVFEAARKFSIKRIIVAGGVAANGRLREILSENKISGEEIVIPSPLLCTDNAAMVAGLGYHYFIKGMVDNLSIDVSARS